MKGTVMAAMCNCEVGEVGIEESTVSSDVNMLIGFVIIYMVLKLVGGKRKWISFHSTMSPTN